MKRISFNTRFINDSGNDLIKGKIHTIRQNYEYWKKFEGKEVALFHWEDKPYRSKQIVFCVKRIVSVQEVTLLKKQDKEVYFTLNGERLYLLLMSHFDGFKKCKDFLLWFNDKNYKPGKMAVLHFTDFRY